MREILETLIGIDEEQEDRYDPEKDLRSKIIDMFYDEGFPLVGEQETDTERQLQFKNGDDIVRVVI